ncbi:MAG: YabP/YqfC family sporulation protein [Lachnospira sp.]
MHNETVVTFCGNREVCIENYKKIIDYEDRKIRILTYRGILAVGGSDFVISYIDQDELCIRGKVLSVNYE